MVQLRFTNVISEQTIDPSNHKQEVYWKAKNARRVLLFIVMYFIAFNVTTFTHQLHQHFLLRVRRVESVPTSRPLLQTLADVYWVMSSGPTLDTDINMTGTDV